MTDSVLVTWATRFGATEEVAQAVAAALRQSGLTVEARPIAEIKTVEPYSAIVLGCALYAGHIHRDARRFLAAHRSELLARPVAVFVLGPVHSDEKEWHGARAQVSKELARLPWFTPVALEVFGGRWDPSKMGFPFSWLPGVQRIPVSDARDWEAIRQWAGTLVSLLQQAPVGA